jgi:chromosome segregation protein
VISSEIGQSEKSVEETLAALGEARAATARLEEEKAAIDVSVRGMNSELNSSRERERLCEADLASVKVREAGDMERLRSVHAVIERIGRELKASHDEVQQLLAGITANNQTQARLRVELEATEGGARTLVERLSVLKDGLGDRRGRYDSGAAGVHAAEDELKGLREQLNSARSGLSGLQILQRERELTMDHMRENARDRLDVDLAAINHDLAAPEPITADDSARLEHLRGLIAEMGEINLLAIKEFEELTQRREFLTVHRDDLNRSLESLQRAIQKINRTSRERFIETFHTVDAAFKEVFPRLFHGGRAGLKLMDETDILESGVDIIAQPPGKKLQSIDLLSGGEKALTAIALIFSIFLIKPSPFCLMDEVDAPLDDANIGRFLSMLSELSARSQFIVITHNKRTMEIAPKLYGVTMEDPGVSKIISVKMNRAGEVVEAA